MGNIARDKYPVLPQILFLTLEVPIHQVSICHLGIPKAPPDGYLGVEGKQVLVGHYLRQRLRLRELEQSIWHL